MSLYSLLFDRVYGASGGVTLSEAIDMVCEGTHTLLVWNGCYGGGPDLSKEGKLLKGRLENETFDKNPHVILMEVLRILGSERATGRYSRFVLGLIEPRYEKYIGYKEYDGSESRFVEHEKFVKDQLEEHLEIKGVLTKEEYEEMVKEGNSIEIVGVSIP